MAFVFENEENSSDEFDWSQYDSIDSIYEDVHYFSYLTPLGKEIKEKYSEEIAATIAFVPISIGLFFLAFLLWKLLKRMIYSIFYISTKGIVDAKKSSKTTDSKQGR